MRDHYDMRSDKFWLADGVGHNHSGEPVQIDVFDQLTSSIPVGAAYRQHRPTLPAGTRITDFFPGGEKSEWVLVTVSPNKDASGESIRVRLRLK